MYVLVENQCTHWEWAMTAFPDITSHGARESMPESLYSSCHGVRIVTELRDCVYAYELP